MKKLRQTMAENICVCAAKKLLTTLKKLRHKAYLFYCHLLPLQNNKIILWSDNFKTFGCSPKYIALYLAKHYPGKYDIVWVLERDRQIPLDLPCGIRIVRYFSMQYLKEISTAKVIVCNHRTGDYHFFKKRRGQYYIQTWHSSLRLKMIEADASLSKEYERIAKKDSEKIDLLLSGCGFSSEIFRRAFWYNGEILEKGTPRCDGFFGDNSKIRKKVFDYFRIDLQKKLALYAPTFRNKNEDALCGMDFTRLKEALGDEWVIGCRLHPNLNTEVSSEQCIPMSKYPDMQELLLSCDLLITDYSSSMFDMALAQKECVLFVPDLEAYRKNERGLYFDPDTLPFPKATSMDELCLKIKDWQGYTDACKKFKSKIKSFETGCASQDVAKKIQLICSEKQK